jgi:hypothetical protein
MSVKLKSEHIKKKIRDKFGDLEVYNPISKETYEKLSSIIRDNSTLVSKDNISDVQINNTTKIFREMLINLTNIENEEYWNGIDDVELESMINLSYGDFKKVVNSLLDIMMEITQDNRILDIRKLDILNNKLIELKEAMVANANIDNTLSSLGLDRDKLSKIQQGDKDVIKEFENNFLNMIKAEQKPKRKYNKKKK